MYSLTRAKIQEVIIAAESALTIMCHTARLRALRKTTTLREIIMGYDGLCRQYLIFTRSILGKT